MPLPMTAHPESAQVPCSVPKYHVFAVVRTPHAHSAGKHGGKFSGYVIDSY